MKYKAIFVFFSFLLLVSLSTCQNKKAQEYLSTEQSTFFVNDASHLYFKNVRAYYYNEKPGPGPNTAERMNLYRLRKFSDTSDRPILYPIIVDNWIKDEAYLFIEGNDYNRGFKNPLTVLAIEANDTTTLELTRPTMDMQLTFTESLATSLEAGQELLVLDSTGTAVPIFTNKQDQLNFLTTIKDYKKLTE
ncbi:MAG: hypothetical protein Sapg2KO_18170 [Saprospiraceae bacterium]